MLFFAVLSIVTNSQKVGKHPLSSFPRKRESSKINPAAAGDFRFRGSDGLGGFYETIKTIAQVNTAELPVSIPFSQIRSIPIEEKRRESSLLNGILAVESCSND